MNGACGALGRLSARGISENPSLADKIHCTPADSGGARGDYMVVRPRPRGSGGQVDRVRGRAAIIGCLILLNRDNQIVEVGTLQLLVKFLDRAYVDLGACVAHVLRASDYLLVIS